MTKRNEPWRHYHYDGLEVDEVVQVNRNFVRATIHVLIDDRLACGSNRGECVLYVKPHNAKFVTCKRCLASLRK